ncbi:NeuD/PglB/VioB family sugar acetyltransferase [Microbacterium sp. OR21]|uniref:NeuD/PglB/VioB family sugar acetyltransferase n=1 Tax=Microbacterium sp. OR21 TaxID=3095346 RepID=UPI0039B57FCC
MPEDIVVIGAGGFGRETLDVIEAINEVAEDPIWSVVGVIDDSPRPIDVDRLGARGYYHLGTISDNVEVVSRVRHVIAIGSPAVRSYVRLALGQAKAVPALVHPNATIGSEVQLGMGVVVCGGVQLSTNVSLGEHVHVNPGAIIGHDTVVGDFVSVNPGAILSGSANVRRRVLIGAGAVVLQGLNIGEGATVGAAACVTRDVSPGVVVKGVPAR